MTDDACNLESLEFTEIFMLSSTALFHVYKETSRLVWEAGQTTCVLAETLTFYRGVRQGAATLISLK